MLSVSLLLFRGDKAGGDGGARDAAWLRDRPPLSKVAFDTRNKRIRWFLRLVSAPKTRRGVMHLIAPPLAALGGVEAAGTVRNDANSVASSSSRQAGATQCSGSDSGRQERPASSPCPSTSSGSSSDDSSSSSSSASSSSTAQSSDSSNNSSDSEEEPPRPPAKDNGSDRGDEGDEKKKEKEEEEDDGNSSDSSSSSESTAAGADESDQEEDDGVVLDTEEEETPLKPTLAQDASNAPVLNEDSSSESDGSSDLENAYPRLPSAPVDALIALRRQAAREDLQMSSELKDEEVARARQRQQERHELAQHAKRRKKTTQTSKRRHSKQGGDAVANGSGKTARSGRRHSNGTNGHADVTLAPPLGAVQQQQTMTEDEWMVDCSCGRREKNFDDGSSMIQCDSCSHWVHAKCADKLPEAVAQENFLCFRCGWMFDCVCDVRRRPNHDDGQRMVECEGCKTWQHTACVGVPMTEEPPDDYLCPRCVKKASRRKAAAKPSAGHLRQRKRDHLEPPRRDRKSRDASPVPVVDMRVSAPSGDSTTAVGSTVTNKKKSDEAKPEKKEPLVSLPPPPLAPAPTPTPAASPPSTPPPPPSTPPPPSVAPPHALPGFAKHEHVKRKKERVEKHLPSSKSSSNRKRGRPHGSSSSSSKKKHPQLETPGVTRLAPPPATVTPSPTGKGAMIRGFSASTPSLGVPTSLSVIVRPPLPLTPPSGGASSGHSHSSHGHGGRKRKGGSARDRLAKKLKIKKSSRR